MQTPAIVLAASRGDKLMVRALIGQKVEIDARDNSGWWALMWAVWGGEIATALDLLEARAYPNLRDRAGDFPLKWAAFFGYMNMVDALLHHGAKPGMRDRQDMTAADWAERNGHTRIAARLKRCAAKLAA